MEERVSREGGGFDDTLGAYIQAMVGRCAFERETATPPDPQTACYTVTASLTLKGEGVSTDRYCP
jgi:hypothetical protein